MRNYTRFGFVFFVSVFLLLSSALFIVAGTFIFSIRSDTLGANLEPLTSTTTTVSITLDPLNAYLDESVYTITRNTPCVQIDKNGNCADMDPVADLCKYMAMSPIDGGARDRGFSLHPNNQTFYFAPPKP